MKNISMITVCLLLALAPVAPCVAAGVVAKDQLSPVTRVVELLKGLQDHTEIEGKKEEDLFNAFVCWGKTIINDKTASNAASDSRIEMLNTYIADLDAGRIELTSERVNLEKDLETIHADIEIATDIRNKEAADFAMAKDEMDQGIAALEDAIQVLKTATAGHETGVLLRVNSGLRSASAQGASLSRAVALGQRFLSKGDAMFLQRLLTGEVPTWDWKKLNRKATFKMSYKARSFKIQDVLSQLLQTFSSNLADATKKDADAQASYTVLMGAKEKQKSAAQDALNRMEKESGAKGMSRGEASDEVSLLTSQITNDKKYMAEVQQALADKKGEWQARQTLRSEEQAAISKAISILHNDDSRDLFKRSFKSQGYFLVQESDSSEVRTRSAAVTVLRDAGHASRDRRMLTLATQASTGRYDKVLFHIGKMLDTLRAEEEDDLAKKEECEKDRMADTREAVQYSRSMDEDTDTMNRLEAEIQQLVKEIAGANERIAEVDEELKKAKELRNEENAAYAVAKKDDQDAAKTVEQATHVLQSFYTSNGLMLAQKVKKVPGEAPIPPPTTWEAPYGGKTQHADGIIAILGMVKEDIEKDIRKGDADEADALALYQETVKKLGVERSDLTQLVTKLTKTKGTKDGDHSDTKGERLNKKGSLDIVMKKIADAEDGCNYFTIKYPLRLKNRQIEIDGLLRAQGILKGGNFGKPADPSREIKPGDAFLQPTKKHTQ